MHRIFCAATEELEDVRHEFYAIIGDFNEKVAAERGMLLVPLSITPVMADKRHFEPVIDANIRSCSFYMQLIENTWGVPHKNFEHDWALAKACEADPALPMREVVALRRQPGTGDWVELGLAEPLAFSGMEEYREICWRLLNRWLEQVTPQ